MTLRPVLALLSIASSVMAWGWATSATGQAVTMTGVERPERARQNYILKCQGCHRPDASGSDATAPAMAGVIGQFLSVKGGREYLARVPGVSTAALGDAELAEVLNWTLWRFDAAHMPQNFKPYTAAEIGHLRRDPLRTNASAMRKELIAKIESYEPAAAKQ